ncbi:MAG: response regulator [Caldimonas sp.]
MTLNNLSRTPSRPLRALLVDDDRFTIDLLSDMLNDLGVTDVKTAKNGTEGYAAFQNALRKPDVVLCDLNMPDTDGFEFMELIAGNQYKGGIIFISGMDNRVRNSAQLMGRFHQLNVLGTLGKPVDRVLLAEALAKA